MHVYGVPIDEQKTGCAKAPRAVIDVLSKGLNEDFALPQVQYHEVPVSSLEAKQLETLSTNACQQPRPLFIGGDHAISYSLIKGFTQVYKDSGLILFDAYVHCGSDTLSNYLRKLIEEGIIKPERILLVGIRAYDAQEIAFLKQHGIRFIAPNQIVEEGIADTAFAIMEIAREWPSVYLSLSITVVDPAFAPGTSHSSVGGLTSRELLFFIQKLKLVKNIKAYDIVDINPENDNQKLTVRLGATLVAAFY